MQQIFTHLPTDFLLSSCSFVNKMWNREARSVIRDQKICWKRKHPKNCRSVCQNLVHLDELCHEITAFGRLIPWNGLKVAFRSHEDDEVEECMQSDEAGVFLNSQTDFNLKHLKISWQTPHGKRECGIHEPVRVLLQKCAPELRTLKLHKLEEHHGAALTSFVSQLPALEEMSISKWYSSEDEDALKNIVQKLLEISPGLKRIATKTVEDLTLIPESVYHQLRELELNFRTIEDEKMYLRIVGKEPLIRKLRVKRPSFWWPRGVEDVNDDADFAQQEELHEELMEHFNNTLELLLRSCAKTLSKMILQNLYSLDNLSVPLFPILKELSLQNEVGRGVNALWNFVTSIDYGKTMPNLDTVKVIIKTVSGAHGDGDYQWESLEIATEEWPDMGENGANSSSQRCCHQILNLKLVLELRILNWPIIQCHFPNLHSLQLELGTYFLDADPVPLSEIFRLWPELKELKIKGFNMAQSRSYYDADCCGINEEEAELLGQEDEGYLRNVMIVPIRPSLSTMFSK